MSTSIESTRQKTIDDFGDQWSNFKESPGAYGDHRLLQDIFGPLMKTEELAGKEVLEIGSGAGRIAEMLLKSGAGHVHAVEPASGAYQTLCENVSSYGNVTPHNRRGDDLPADARPDYVLSIGVIHHIKDPLSTLKAAHDAIKPGGRILIWVYGREGNTLYLALFKSLHSFTRFLPHKALHLLSKALCVPLNLYCTMCRHLPLPMRDYFNNVISKWDQDVRVLTIYDQLNPEYARYYRENEITGELSRAGFKNVKTHHRHGYSWTVLGEKPAKPRADKGNQA